MSGVAGWGREEAMRETRGDGAVAGVSLCWRSRGLDFDPMPALASWMSGERGGREISVELRGCRDPVPAPDIAKLVFHHGRTRVFVDGKTAWLHDGCSLVRVDPGGTSVDGDVHPASLEDGRIFGTVTMLMALVLALRWQSRYHVHAGCVVLPDGRTALIAGNSGSGKSTTTLALVAAGCRWVSDDAVFLDTTGAGETWALPRAFHMAPNTRAAFPELARLARQGALAVGEKFELDPRAAFPGRGMERAPWPTVMVLPRVTGESMTRVIGVDAAEVIGGLLTSSALATFDELHGFRGHIDALHRVADEARAVSVHLGSDLLASPQPVAAAILASVGGGR